MKEFRCSIESDDLLVRLEMKLKDVPGQLVKVLEPISRFGGNIRNVVHQRERKTPLGGVPVTVIFDVGERSRFNKIMAALRGMGVRIIRVGEREGAVRVTTLLIGHVIHTDLRDTVNRLNAIKGVVASDLSLAMGEVGEESASRLTITASDERRAEFALSALEKIAARKKLLMIKSLEEM